MKHKLQAVSRGFTLIEVMVVVGIIGILASIAYPAYQEYIRKARRADAAAALLENAQFLERFFTENNRYDEDAAGTAVSLPVTVSPRESGGGSLYSITLDGAATTATTFRLLATPIAGGAMASDDCGTLTLNQLGQKGVSGGSLSAAQCWQ